MDSPLAAKMSNRDRGCPEVTCISGNGHSAKNDVPSRSIIDPVRGQCCFLLYTGPESH